MSRYHTTGQRKNEFETTTVYQGIIQIPEDIGTSRPYQLILVVDLNNDVYWTTLSNIGFHSPDDGYFPVGKKLKNLTQEDIALILAKAHMRESKTRGIQMLYEPEVLAIEIQTISPGLVNQTYQSVNQFLKK